MGEREAAIESLSAGLEEFFNGASSEGPFYTGDKFGIIDIALAPFIARLDSASVCLLYEISFRFSTQVVSPRILSSFVRMEILAEFVGLKFLQGGEAFVRLVLFSLLIQ